VVEPIPVQGVAETHIRRLNEWLRLEIPLKDGGYILLTRLVTAGLYTDESPGLKVDPVVVLVLSLVFIFSVVALHSEFSSWNTEALLPC
jgi:hypothetical protein